MNQNNKKKIIVIGGGYAGISLLHELKGHNNLTLTLIDKAPHHLMQTHIHKYLSGYYNRSELLYDYRTYCEKNGIEFIQDEVTHIAFNEQFIQTKNSQRYDYDVVVIATGSCSFFPSQIKNVTQFTKDIKAIEHLDFYRKAFLDLLHSEPKNRHIVVVGGGVSGLQIACEYAHTIQSHDLTPQNIDVTLVEGLDTILPNMDPFLIEKSRLRCEQLGIKIITKRFASELDENKIILSDGSAIDYDLLIFVIGVIGNAIEKTSDGITPNPRNQYIVDEYYQIPSYPNAYAIGDVVQARDVKTNNFQAPTAQAARMQALLVSKNILKRLEHKTGTKNNISNKGIFIDLGGTNCAIGKLFSINLSGKIALFMKKLIYALHIRKLNKM
ncbi:NAD(P)/FAD-dependent oxidoreductase [Sulfurospirillum sp. 1612]|uniref:NAD(P)/FAD-dependent oxidoreductase n=1 Tax=Sulfurospirillum sp. 1612 TaxID=3094835 RepID=UPI002F9411D9